MAVVSEKKAPAEKKREKLFKILVIDEFDHGEVMGPVLASELDCRAWNTRSGAKGLEFAHKIVPDVIIAGYRMQDMQAPEFFKKLQADAVTKDIPVISWSMLGKPDEFHKLGATWFFSKPYKVDRVLKVVRRIAAGESDALKEEFGKKLERVGTFHHNAWHSYP